MKKKNIETVNMREIFARGKANYENRMQVEKRTKKRYKLTQMAKCFITVLLTGAVQLFLINMNGINYALNIVLYTLLFFVITKIIFKEEI